MGINIVELYKAMKQLEVSTPEEAEKILNHGITVEDYPSSVSKVEKTIHEDRRGNTYSVIRRLR